MTLFEPDRHEPLASTTAAWEVGAARAAIGRLVDDIVRARLPAGHWPVHPLDDDDGSDAQATGYQSLYLGSAGVVWALWWLKCVAAADPQIDFSAAIRCADDAYRQAPDTGEAVPSYFLNDVGIGLLRWRITGESDAADRVSAAVQANIPNPTNEALWAAPGTMIAAWHLWQATGEARWRTLFGANVDQLWRTWHEAPAVGGWLWTQDLYGRSVQYLGAGHGFVGNLLPLLKGAALLDDARRETLVMRAQQTLQATATHDGEAANWPPAIAPPRPGRPPFLMQWCHGAPGVVSALADLPVGVAPALDALLVAAGEAVWRAGPLAKGVGLCHGTAGNALALLTLHRRTGDAVWLTRARAFVMHAVAQSDAMREQHGRGRYTLWTGDPGLAVALWQCLDEGAPAGMPALDFIG
ncbi:MAG: LanC-like protein [Rubrivivax sp.]